MVTRDRGIANLSHSVGHFAGESQFCLTLPIKCGATFSLLKKLLKLIHVHLYMAKFTTSGGQEEKQRKTMKRIIRQTLKKYNFRKLFQLNNFEQHSRTFRTASCRHFFIENSNCRYYGNEIVTPD